MTGAYTWGQFKHPLSSEHLELRLQVSLSRTLISFIAYSVSIRMTIFLRFCHAGRRPAQSRGFPRPAPGGVAAARCLLLPVCCSAA